MRVLIAEDEPRLAEALARGLRRNGFAVDIALDGNQALKRTAVVDYDVVVLDRDLPYVHGDEVCRQLVGAERPPRILMLTAEQAADLLQTDAEAVLAMADAGELPGRKIGDEWRFLRRAVLAWLGGAAPPDSAA